MTNPELGDQLTRILASLEKATPQVLDLATKMMRQEALANGITMLLCLALALVAASRLWRWLRSEAGNNADETQVCFAYIALGVCCVATTIVVVNLPEQITKLSNARYYAIADLLARVKP